MVFAFITQFVLAAAVVFIVLNIFTPVLYTIWYSNVRDTITNSVLLAAGDSFFSTYQILSILIPGIIIAWGFIVVQRKRVEEQEI